MTKGAEPPLIVPRLVATLSAQRARIEAVLARADRLSSPRVVHDLRVALRRTAALARLTRGVPSEGDGETLRVAARDLRRALGSQRTLEVSVARLRTRFRRDAARRRTAEALAARIAPQDEGSSSGRAAGRRLSALRRAFEERARELAALQPPFAGPADSKVERDLKKTIRRRLKKKVKRLRSGGSPTAETLHVMRIAAKDLRYSLEVVSDVMPGAEKLLSPLEKFQDSAGAAHDRAELIAIVRRAAGEVPEALRRAALKLLPPLLIDSETALRRAQAHAEKLLHALSNADLDWSKT